MAWQVPVLERYMYRITSLFHRKRDQGSYLYIKIKQLKTHVWQICQDVSFMWMYVNYAPNILVPTNYGSVHVALKIFWTIVKMPLDLKMVYSQKWFSVKCIQPHTAFSLESETQQKQSNIFQGINTVVQSNWDEMWIN